MGTVKYGLLKYPCTVPVARALNPDIAENLDECSSDQHVFV